MKTYADLITEAMHHASHVGEWGAITDSGELIDGRTHPTAKSHVQLGGIHPVEYFQDHMSDEHEEGALCIRTRSVNGLKLAIDHFNKLPHYKHGAVVHEHEHEEDFGYYSDGSSGKRYSVLTHMKRLHAKLDDGKTTK